MRNEFPNPQFKRDTWQTLNGEWQFSFDDEKLTEGMLFGTENLPLKINVPYAFQCELSGINDTTVHDTVWYKRTFTLSAAMQKAKGVILRFLACDYECTVWVNGRFACAHKGGYGAFCADITKLIKDGEQTVTVKVVDLSSASQPRGKQTWLDKPHGCWYYSTTGIWQSVWLEGHGGDYMEDIFFTPDFYTGQVKTTLKSTLAEADEIRITVDLPEGGKRSFSSDMQGGAADVSFSITRPDLINDVHAWTPENPVLYFTTVTALKNGETLDSVKTYFAFRSVRAESGRIYLNDQPVTLKLVLDQGYWADGGMTAPSAESFKQDIMLAKAMGFNGARKHQKIEDPYFCYYADTLGFFVWAETPSAYEYSAEEARELTATHFDLIKKVYNNPSVIAYVPLNESWGVGGILNDEKQQAFAKTMYHLTKATDPTRIVITNDGWENMADTDLITVHDYSKYGDEFENKYSEIAEDTYPMWKRLMAKGQRLVSKPIMLTEYGGVSINTDGGGWGYSGAENSVEDFLTRFERLNENAFCGVFCGACYTQLTDVEHEMNGLLDAWHRPKMSVHQIRAILEKFDKKEKIL